MSKIVVPTEKLQEGFAKCQKQIESLLDASGLLYDSKKYLTSYPLVILAYEEIAKLKFIQVHLERNEGISKKDWEKMTRGGLSHRNKLTYAYVDAQNRFVGREAAFHKIVEISKDLGQIMSPPTFKEVTTLNPVKLRRLENLDKMKQECFYVGWDGKNWTSFAMLKEIQQEALVHEYLIQAKLELAILMVRNKHPSIYPKGHPEYQKFKDEPLQKVIRDLIRIKDSADYKKKAAIAHLTLDQYFKDQQPRRNNNI